MIFETPNVPTPKKKIIELKRRKLNKEQPEKAIEEEIEVEEEEKEEEIVLVSTTIKLRVKMSVKENKA